MSLSNSFIVRPVLTTVQVSAQYVGADAESVEQGVTAVLEQQINGLENMEFITSASTADGSSRITVSFASGSDGDINQVTVQNRVARASLGTVVFGGLTVATVLRFQ